ncbi:unnamed protein product [Caenorhabditis auriculariae]|uniref:Mitogen-activated protein kinase n=1 Tax=Caenorhabditis auriculariae TaxID=2777116 RepID=A0A8S1H9T6_9PELO|nr:unnamed protein product [Caenorhabditis auriculariae]
MLVLDPDKRISVDEALRHDYLREYYAPHDEPVADKPVGVDAAEEAAVTIDDWRHLIWQEIQLFQASGRRLSYNSSNENRSLSDSSNGFMMGDESTTPMEESSSF